MAADKTLSVKSQNMKKNDGDVVGVDQKMIAPE